MGNFEEKEVCCPNCLKANISKLYTAITMPNDYKLHSSILNSDIFKVNCSNCGEDIYISYPLVYTDLKRRFIICYKPDFDKDCLSYVYLEDKYQELDYIIRRVVPDYNSLKEKIYCFENSLDDMAIEISKYAVARVIAEKLNIDNIDKGYLSIYDACNNTIGFTFFVGDDKKPYLQIVRLELYAKSLKIVQDIAVNERHKRDFLKIDIKWAENMVIKYNKIKDSKKINKTKLVKLN